MAKYLRILGHHHTPGSLAKMKAFAFCESPCVSPRVWLIRFLHSPSHCGSYSQSGLVCQAAAPLHVGLTAWGRAGPNPAASALGSAIWDWIDCSEVQESSLLICSKIGQKKTTNVLSPATREHICQWTCCWPATVSNSVSFIFNHPILERNSREEQSVLILYMQGFVTLGFN